MAYQSGGAGGKGALSLIQTITTAGGQTTIDFTGIPATANSLQLVGLVGSAFAGAGLDDLNLTLNGISSISYAYAQLIQGASAVFVAGNNSQIFAALGSVLASSAGASFGSGLDLLIPNYAGLNTKRHFQSRISSFTTVDVVQYITGGHLDSAAVVSRLTLALGNGPFQDGFPLRLYGLT